MGRNSVQHPIPVNNTAKSITASGREGDGPGVYVANFPRSSHHPNCIIILHRLSLRVGNEIPLQIHKEESGCINFNEIKFTAYL